jgi:hypothetical protein
VSPSKRADIEVRASGADDWRVAEQGGREFGHYPSRQAAEAVGRKLAQKRKVTLLIFAADGRLTARSRPGAGWLSRLFRG